MNTRSHIFLLLSCLIGKILFSQNIEFIENKGQWDNRVKFMGQVPAGAFYVHKDGFTVLQNNAGDMEAIHDAVHGNIKKEVTSNQRKSLLLRSHAYRVDFIGSNPKPEIVPDKPLFTYNNYYIGDDPSKWATGCKVYQGITIKDIYPNVDIRYYTDKGTMKYDLVIKPGGDVSRIAFKYDGVEKIEVKNKELNIATSVGTLRELYPYSYQFSDKGKNEVAAKYSIKGNVVRFDIKNYDPSSTLIIDPTLIFSSFSGSTADNWGFTATYGPDGSMFGGGVVFGSGFPTSTGAHQIDFQSGASGCFAGPMDIGIIKLSADGTQRLYATYLGGIKGNEMPQSLITDAAGNLIIAGKTNSTDYPLRNGGLIGPGGGWDIILTKLNNTGGLIASRMIGGANDDGANITPCGGASAISLQRNYGDEARSEVNIDGANNVYLASCTQSTNFPTQGGFQNSNRSDATHTQDGVVLKFTPDLSSLLFSTYLGGNGNDAAYVLSLNPSNNNIYVAGGTESTDLLSAGGGTISSVNVGSIDGFVSIISNNGSSLIKTTYVGTSGIDQVYGLKFDPSGFPYIMGQTTGTWPIINAPWRELGGKQFIAKLQPDLSSYVYSTAFGKGDAVPDISPVAFLVDRCENVYVSGWGGKVGSSNFPSAGTSGLPVTPDAIKTTTDISSVNGLGQDFYFFVLKKNATTQLYGSFFGQNGGLVDHVDGGTSRFDQNGVIYQAICANCAGGASFPTTPGAWSTTNPAAATGHCNLAMVKIAFNLAGVGSGVESFIEGIPRDTAGCVPLTVDFVDTLLQAVSYEWNFGDGSPQIKTNTPNATHTYLAVGTYKVMLVAIDSSTCNIRDTSYTNIKVGATKAGVDFTPNKQGDCRLFQYRFDNTSTVPAGFSFSSNAFTWDFGDGTAKVTTGYTNVTHTYASAGTYNVVLYLNDSTFCNSPDSIAKQLRVASLVKADFETPPNGCAPYNAQFKNTSAGGNSFTWDFGDGSTSTDPNPTHLYPVPGTYVVSLIAVDSATCNIIDSTKFTITVYGIPVADFSAAPQPPLVNTPISFTNLSSPDAVRFKWYFGDGDSLITTSRNVIQHEYNSTGTFNACLIAFNPANCSDTVCKVVTTLIEPALDVPNAFTPLSKDQNNKVFVRGYGIARMKFTIWARWGEKVFETETKSNGWDGYYKGKLLPMDVYAFTLDVEFSDGTKSIRKGDITLIR